MVEAGQKQQYCKLECNQQDFFGKGFDLDAEKEIILELFSGGREARLGSVVCVLTMSLRCVVGTVE